jgi:diaminopimelate epimerase
VNAVRFVKMQGLGNDFVVLGDEVVVTPAMVRELCNRRFGVGADGVLQLAMPDLVTMTYWNADGSTAEMCGNGLRCVARRAVDIGLQDPGGFDVATPSGVKRVHVDERSVSVDLGPVTVGGVVEIDGSEYVTADVGNPHAVRSVDPSSIDVAEVGSRVGRDAMFPNGSNVEFYATTGPSSVTMRVWERGVGETLACGTGIVATAAVARHRGDVTIATVEVETPGGTATVDLTDGAWLTGPAVTVFSGLFSGPS